MSKFNFFCQNSFKLGIPAIANDLQLPKTLCPLHTCIGICCSLCLECYHPLPKRVRKLPASQTALLRHTVSVLPLLSSFIIHLLPSPCRINHPSLSLSVQICCRPFQHSECPCVSHLLLSASKGRFLERRFHVEFTFGPPSVWPRGWLISSSHQMMAEEIKSLSGTYAVVQAVLCSTSCPLLSRSLFETSLCVWPWELGE